MSWSNTPPSPPQKKGGGGGGWGVIATIITSELAIRLS